MITIILLELVIVMKRLLKNILSICNLSIMFKLFVMMMVMVFSIHLLLMRKPIMIMICLLYLMIMVMKIMIAILLNFLPVQLLGITMLMWGVIIICIWLMIRMFYVMIILMILFMMLLETTMKEVNIRLLVFFHLEILDLDLIFCA